MVTPLLQAILHDRKLAYALTDRALCVVEVGGELTILQPAHDTWPGRTLLDLVPELVGSEDALAAILTGSMPSFELPFLNRESTCGEPSYITIVELPYLGADGQISGLLHLVQDKTEAGTLRQQLSQQHNQVRLAQAELDSRNHQVAAANAELQRLNDIKSTFVSVAAHELRTPLTAIQGYAEMLLEEEAGTLTGIQREYLHIVHQAADRLWHITESLLTVTRIEAGQMDLVLLPTDLFALIQSVVTELEPQLKAKGQHWVITQAPDLPLALCDRLRVEQIIANLLSNAIKYTPPEGHVSIALDRAADEGFVQVSVTDDGVGIPAADQDKLFLRFFRASNAARAKVSGAGLGLYVTRALVELHGGRVWVESEIGRGSTFFVTFHIAN